MSKNEDYLDDLLNSVSDANRRNNKRDIEDLIQSMNEEAAKPRERENKPRRRKADYGEHFLREFEQELAIGAADEFLENFEMELEEEAAAEQPDINLGEKLGDMPDQQEQAAMPDDGTETGTPDGSAEAEASYGSMQAEAPDVSSIMNGVKQMVESGVSAPEEGNVSEEGALMPEEPLGFGQESLLPEEGLGEPLGSQADSGETILPEEEGIQDGSDLLNMLSGDDELSDIGDLLKADEEGESLINEEDLAALDELAELEEQSDDIQDEFDRLGSIEELKDLKDGKKGRKGKKKQKSGSLLTRLAQFLFGPEEEGSTTVPEEAAVGNISDENMDILKELDGSGKVGKKSKKDKKDKKAKGKNAEGEKKPKDKKPKKPKKEKAPKEKDNTPPLPKKPVILIVLMAASILALILLGVFNIPYGQDVKAAKDYYAAGDYVKAYETLAGSSAKDKDEKLYRKTLIMASIQSEYNAYESMMELEDYEFALDALVRGVGRYDNYLEEAAECGAQEDLELEKNKIVQAMSDTFGVTEEQALELNGIRKRTDYTRAIHQILDGLGLPY